MALSVSWASYFPFKEDNANTSTGNSFMTIFWDCLQLNYAFSFFLPWFE